MVRNLVRTVPGLLLVLTLGILVAFVGLAITVSGQDKVVGFLVLVAGLYVAIAAPVLHDRIHRERGEPPHAVWGRGERWKPWWWHR